VIGYQDIVAGRLLAIVSVYNVSHPLGPRGSQAFCTALQEASLESREGNQV
jgi:hypothetical protein